MIRNADYVMTLIIDPEKRAKKAQVGVDLTIKAINRIGQPTRMRADNPSSIYEDKGIIYNDESLVRGNKNNFGIYTPIAPEDGFFHLEEGTYSVEFDQGIRALPKNNTAFIWQRSTLGRNGVLIRSSVYDPGFETPNMGAILFVGRPVNIELHARIAQIVIHENEPTELYNGQYMGLKDFR